MDKYNKTERPTAYDVLGVVLPDAKKTKAKVKYYSKKKEKMFDFINPNFQFKNETLRYTDKETNREYSKIYYRTIRAAKYNIK